MGRSPLLVDAVVETRDRRFFLMAGDGRYMVASEAICFCCANPASTGRTDDRRGDAEEIMRPYRSIGSYSRHYFLLSSHRNTVARSPIVEYMWGQGQQGEKRRWKLLLSFLSVASKLALHHSSYRHVIAHMVFRPVSQLFPKGGS